MAAELTCARCNDDCHAKAKRLEQELAGALRSETVTIEKHPDTIIAKIVEDIRGRKGLSDEWDNIDVDVRNEIVAEWRTYFTPSISKGSADA